jgi:hypothetical protein
MIKEEPNGLPFDRGFHAWRMISFTDRGDNRTVRFVLGNATAVKAAETGNISPWPDGTRFAKIAWQQETGSDGLVHPGRFLQLEIMVKDASRYKNSAGWGWGRWLGEQLQPYGKDAQFVNECTGCHLPMHGDDDVYTLPITTARGNRREVVNNHGAALPAQLPAQPLSWEAITMYVDAKSHGVSALFGNQTAMETVRAARVSSPAATISYSPGSVLALVTWAQRDDPHWYGARIPDVPESVELLQIESGDKTAIYHFYRGATMLEDHANATAAARRTAFILHLAPAQMP